MRCTVQLHDDLADFNQAPPLPNALRYKELTGDCHVQDMPLASESALAISYNGISQAVMMVTSLRRLEAEAMATSRTRHGWQHPDVQVHEVGSQLYPHQQEA